MCITLQTPTTTILHTHETRIQNHNDDRPTGAFTSFGRPVKFNASHTHAHTHPHACMHTAPHKANHTQRPLQNTQTRSVDSKSSLSFCARGAVKTKTGALALSLGIIYTGFDSIQHISTVNYTE